MLLSLRSSRPSLLAPPHLKLEPAPCRQYSLLINMRREVLAVVKYSVVPEYLRYSVVRERSEGVNVFEIHLLLPPQRRPQVRDDDLGPLVKAPLPPLPVNALVPETWKVPYNYVNEPAMNEATSGRLLVMFSREGCAML